MRASSTALFCLRTSIFANKAVLDVARLDIPLVTISWRHVDAVAFGVHHRTFVPVGVHHAVLYDGDR